MGQVPLADHFLPPWAQWDGEQVFAVNLPYQHLHHQVILVSDQEKAVSSSMAHQLVPSSPHYENRHQRAKDRLEALTAALQEKQWQRAYELTWQEFQDMHALFATASPGFSYLTDDSPNHFEFITKKLGTPWRWPFNYHGCRA